MDGPAFQVLDKTLNDTSKSYIDKIEALLLGWKDICSCLNNSENSFGEMMNFLHKYTLQYLLHGDWTRLEASLRVKFTVVLHKVLLVLSKTDEEASRKCKLLIKLVHEPWQNSTLHKILHSKSPSDDEVCEYITSEGSELLLKRLEVLCEGKCEDLALKLAATLLKHFKHCNEFKKSDIDYITDILLILLFRFGRNQEIIEKLKNLDLKDGLQLVKRFSRRKTNGIGFWKFCDNVTELAAHTVLASGMVQNVESIEKQNILSELINEWALIHVPKLTKCLSTLCNMVRKIVQKAESPIHIYIFAQVLHKQLGNQVKPLCIELYIRGFTTNINLIENHKSTGDDEKILKAEILLSHSFLELSEVLCDNIIIYRECLLTAFSLYPTEDCLKRLEKAALLCSSSKNENSDLKEEESVWNNSNNVSCILKKKNIEEQFIEAVNGLNILNSELLGLAPHLCDDLCTVLSNPRCQTLSWSLGWMLLKKECEDYLSAYFNNEKRKNRNPELKYLNIDYSQFVKQPFSKKHEHSKNKGRRKKISKLSDSDIIKVTENSCSKSIAKVNNEKKAVEKGIWKASMLKINELNSKNSFLLSDKKEITQEPFVPTKPIIIKRTYSRKNDKSNQAEKNIHIINENPLHQGNVGSVFHCNYNPYSRNSVQSPKPAEVPPQTPDSSYHDSTYQSKLIPLLSQKVLISDNYNRSTKSPLIFRNNSAEFNTNKSSLVNQPASNNKILAKYIPGMNSLDLIVPLRPEPTVQVVQIPSPNTILQPVSSNSPSAIQTNSTSIAISKPLTEPMNTQSNDVVTSHSQAHSQSVETAIESTNNSNLLLTTVVNPGTLSRIHGSDQRHSTTHVSSNLALTRSQQKPSSSDSGAAENLNLTTDSTSVGVNTSTHEGSTPVTAHIQRVGQPHKQKHLYDECNALKSSSSNSSVHIPGTIQIFEESNKVSSSSQSSTGTVSGSVYRFILKDGKILEQYCHGNQSSILQLPDLLHESNLQSSVQQEHVIKLLKKKKDPKKEDTISAENVQMPSLPQFHQVFRRQVYQGGSIIEGASIPPSPSQFNEDSSSEIPKQENPSSPLSKAVQTVLKDTEPKTKQSNDKIKDDVPTNVIANQNTIKVSSCTENKETVSDLQSTSGVIFTCKVPLSLSGNAVLQAKPVSIIKTSNTQEVSRTSQKLDSESKGKDSVIRSNMNALLAAALQNNPLKSNTSDSSDNTTIHNVKQIKVGLQEVKHEGPPIVTSKIRMPSPTQKSVKRQPLVQHNVTRFSRPSSHVSSGTTVNQNPSPVVTIPLPTRTVQVLTNINQNPLPNLSKIDNRRDQNISQNNDQSSVSSTTLEQLREFESVLEQVTNTSQMKERSNVKKTEPLTLVQTSNPEFSNSGSSKVNTLFQTSLVSAISDLNTDRVSLTFISKSSTTCSNSLITSNSPKISTSTPVVVVQSCSRPLTSPALSISSQNSPGSSPTTPPSNSQSKISSKLTKPKAKSIGKTTPTATLKVSTLPKPQQKPQEDEQTTQRIYAILDKYAEQLRNSPELKNKPAPRRRSNPPTNPSQSSKRKKSSQGKSKNFSSIPSCSGLEMSPGSEDLRTAGSEDSSNGVSQVTQTISSPHSRNDEHSNPADVASDKSESLDKEQRLQHRILLADQTSGSGRTVIVQDNVQPVISVEGTKVIAGKQLVVGSGATVPLTLSLPGAGNVKQVLFPVPADGRPFVVAKVPKMYRFHQVTMPSGSPLIASASSGTVLLRQMCLNKSNSTLKQVKLPVVSQISSHMASQPTVVLPSGSQSFTLSAGSTTIDSDIGIALDNTILLNSSSTSGSSIGFLQRNLCKTTQASNVISSSRSVTSQESSHVPTSSEVMVSVKTESNLIHAENLNVDCSTKSCVSNKDIKNEEVKFCSNNENIEEKSRKAVPISSTSSSSWAQALKDANVNCNILNKIKEKEEKDNVRKESSDVKGCELTDSRLNRKSDELLSKGGVNENKTVKQKNSESSSYCSDGGIADPKSVQPQHLSDHWHLNIKLEKSCNSIKNESISPCLGEVEKETDSSLQTGSQQPQSHGQGLKRKVENTIFQIAFKRDKIKITKDDLVQQRSASALERELRLQKSLSEECEDLGVDKPSTSDLFPEAELLLDSDPLSRDSLQGELFSRPESSSSSLSSPNCSPVFANKHSNSWKKQRSILRHKFNYSRSISPAKKNSFDKNESSKDAINSNLLSCSSKSVGYDIKNSSSFKCLSNVKGTISGGDQDISMECTDSDPCNFSDVDDDGNDTDILDTEGDSDIDFLPKTHDRKHCDSQKNLNVEKTNESSLLSRLSHSPFNKCEYYSNKDSIVDKRNIDSSPWYHVTKGVHKETLEGDMDKSNNGTIREGLVESVNGTLEDFEDQQDSLNSYSPVKVFQGRKRKKIGLFLASPSEEESGSSLDTVLAGSDSCSGFHDNLSKRSNTRGRVKKGCPCFNGSPEPNKKKKDVPITEKTDKPCSTKSSFSYSTKKPINKSTVKIVNRKR